MNDRNLLRSTKGKSQKRNPKPMVDPLIAHVRWAIAAGDSEAARLKNLAEMTGALPGEASIQWRFLSGVGAWPALR